MSNQNEPLVTCPGVLHIGFAVEDAEKTAEYYTRNFGWGPWQYEIFEVRDYLFRGKIHDYAKMKAAIVFLGNVMIELVETIEGETPASEFLREKGEGINHLHISHGDDLEPILKKLATAGIEPVYRGQITVGDTTHDAFFTDTDKLGGVMFEFSCPIS